MRFIREEVWSPDGSTLRQTLIQPRYIDLKREKLILTEERYEVLDHCNGDIVEVKRSTTSKAGPLNQRATAYFGSPSYGPARAIGGPQFFPFVFVEGGTPLRRCKIRVRGCWLRPEFWFLRRASCPSACANRHILSV